MSNLAEEQTAEQTPEQTREISLRDYQQWTQKTAIYPHAGTGDVEELMYLSLGLVGESGEVANNVKKLFRDGDKPERRDNLKKELGDVMWYMARLATTLDVDLTETISTNKAKLESRFERGVIGGSGDNR